MPVFCGVLSLRDVCCCDRDPGIAGECVVTEFLGKMSTKGFSKGELWFQLSFHDGLVECRCMVYFVVELRKEREKRRSAFWGGG